MAFVTAAFLITAVGSVVFAGPLESPSTALLARCFGWVTLTTITSLALGIGVASLIGSRSTSIGILLAWQLALSNLLLAFSFLGVTRDALLPAATARLAPAALNLTRPSACPSPPQPRDTQAALDETMSDGKDGLRSVYKAESMVGVYLRSGRWGFVSAPRI